MKGGLQNGKHYPAHDGLDKKLSVTGQSLEEYFLSITGGDKRRCSCPPAIRCIFSHASHRG